MLSALRNTKNKKVKDVYMYIYIYYKVLNEEPARSLFRFILNCDTFGRFPRSSTVNNAKQSTTPGKR